MGQRDPHVHPDWFWHPYYGLWWNSRHRRWWSPERRDWVFVGWCDVDEKGEAALRQGKVLHVRAQAVEVAEPPPVTAEDRRYFENAALTAHQQLLDRRVQESLEAISEAASEEEAERLAGEEAFAQLFAKH